MEQTRISVRETLAMHGVSLDELAWESIIPACCSEGCEVEPDGECEHGQPSVFLKLGVI
jgi:hypothetical protein